MKNCVRVGIIIFIVGFSLLAGTFYRSNTTTSFSAERIDMAPNTWSYLDPDDADQTLSEFFEFLLVPRDFQLTVQSTEPIDVYILDSEGIRQWNENKTVDPVFAFKNTKQEIYNFELSKRDKYTVVIYNPTKENVTSRWAISVYSIEKDLLFASVIVTVAGLVVMAVSVVTTQKKPSDLRGKRSFP
ncbi:MAG: hypothetical protein ACFCUE_15655 [Candidatus Bathyarchaeia archaeon]|jgi:hypothetical protein